MLRTSLLLLTSFVLSSCAGTVAGLSPTQRDAVYSAIASVAGHPEYAAIIYGTRRAVTAAKNPVKVNP